MQLAILIQMKAKLRPQSCSKPELNHSNWFLENADVLFIALTVPEKKNLWEDEWTWDEKYIPCWPEPLSSFGEDVLWTHEERRNFSLDMKSQQCIYSSFLGLNYEHFSLSGFRRIRFQSCICFIRCTVLIFLWGQIITKQRSFLLFLFAGYNKCRLHRGHRPDEQSRNPFPFFLSCNQRKAEQTGLLSLKQPEIWC